MFVHASVSMQQVHFENTMHVILGFHELWFRVRFDVTDRHTQCHDRQTHTMAVTDRHGRLHLSELERVDC